MFYSVYVRKYICEEKSKVRSSCGKGNQNSERVNEMKSDHSHILTRRKDFIYLFIGVSLKISQLPENVVVNGT